MPGERTAEGQTLTGENALIVTGDALILAVKIADLASAGTDVACGNIDKLADMFIKLGHKALGRNA